MGDKRNHDERLEKIMNQLADSVLEQSDAETLAEIRETGADPQKEAEHTRAVLRQASKALGEVNKRLSDLGHTINPKYWWRGEQGYHNNCLNCGSLVSFTTATNEMWGNALVGRCPESDQYTIRRRKASGR